MQLNPYIYFNGRCAEALNFYEGALGAKVVMKMTYGESPAANECSKNSLDKIMHARLDVGGSVIMMSDAPEERYSTPQGFSISLNLQDPVEAERVYKVLSAGGNVLMPLEKTFWAQRFAMFTDKFGTPWMINCEKSA
jgi:PhnB protein